MVVILLSFGLLLVVDVFAPYTARAFFFFFLSLCSFHHRWSIPPPPTPHSHPLRLMSHFSHISIQESFSFFFFPPFFFFFFYILGGARRRCPVHTRVHIQSTALRISSNLKTESHGVSSRRHTGPV